MQTELLKRPKTNGTDDDDIGHLLCECDDLIAVCGVVSPLEEGWFDNYPFPCVVCSDFVFCPKCGESLRGEDE